MGMKFSERKRFVLKYSVQALASLLLVFGGMWLFKELYFDHNPEYWLEKFYGNSLVIHLIYVASEVFFGIFPPEIFIFWAVKSGNVSGFIIDLIFFAVVSLGAGHLAYWIGRYLARKVGPRIRRRTFISQYLPTFKKFGGLLIVIAALTPLPWSTISLVMGAIEYRYSRFTWFAFARLARFAVNGFIIFQSGARLF